MATSQTPPAAADQTKELVKQSDKRSVKDLLTSEDFRNQVAMALPKHMKAERFIRVALNSTMRQPELLQCQRESLFLALLQLSAYGIEADGRRAHLIPFWDHKVCVCGHEMDQHRSGQCSKCSTCNVARKRRLVQLIIDYKGIAELVRRSGDVSYIHADVVLEGDDWDFQFGSEAFLRHKPNMVLTDDKRKIIAFYSFVKLKDGSEDFIVMSKPDVDGIRSRSKSANSGPWVSDYREMGKKTVFRRHSKWLPLSPEVRDAVESDDEGEDFSVSAGVVLEGMSSVMDEAPPDDEQQKETLGDRVKKAAAETQPQEEKPKPQAEEKKDPEPDKPKETAKPASKPPANLYDYLDWDSAQNSKDWESAWIKVAGEIHQWSEEKGNYVKYKAPRPRNAGAFDQQGGEA